MIRKYEKYKDSGVEWIGEIPEGWEVKKLKYVAEICTEKPEDGVRKVALENIESKSGHFIDTDTVFEGEGVVFKRGDILYGKLRPYLAKVWVSEFDGAAVGDFFVIRPQQEISSAYLKYRLLSAEFTDLANGSTFGSKMPRVDRDFMTDLMHAVPSIPEQTAIASFLDRKTAEIAQLIVRKEKLIALYEEEKTAIINHAVTKGLDPTVKTKPSGIEWLGNIPEHWEVKRLKYVANMKSGDGITSDQIKEFGDYPVYGGNGLRGYFDSFTHEGNYVLIGRQGALCGNINYAIGKFWASEHTIVCTLIKHYETRWFGELLRVMNLNQYSVSAAQPGLSIDNIKILQIPVPPISEQTTIVAHIETECSRLNTIIDKFKKQIELFKEYRTTLISEVVTGKTDVRGEVGV
jgi:type I restriction enzyme S subunit